MASTEVRCRDLERENAGVPVAIGLLIANRFEAESILSNHRVQAAET